MAEHGEKTRRESRREKRKEARLLKRKNRLESWVRHHKNNGKRKSSELEDPHEECHKKLEVSDLSDEPESKNELPEKKRKVSKKPSKKTKSQNFLGIEMKEDTKDIEMERKLARKLKVRGGKLGGVDDNLNDLFADISYVLDPGVEDKLSGNKSKKKKKNKKSSEALEEKSQDLVHDLPHEGNELAPLTMELAAADSTEHMIFSGKETRMVEENAKAVKYVAPHLRDCTRMESQDFSHIRRRVRGLLNRISESNVESITGEVATIFRSLTRSDGCCIIGEEVMSSCFDGPRGNEQHAAVFAAFVAGMACLVGMDFSAKLLASLAMAFENEYAKEDNLSLRNIILLLSYLYILGVCSSDLIYDFLSTLSKRMSELDVSTVLAVLQCCGMKLRGDDPSAMKDFIINIQNRVSELKCPSANSAEAQPKISNKRMEFMLETICEIKNNKKREKQEPAHHTRIKKWLQKLKADDILLRGIKWSQLLDAKKKGQWWLSGNATSTDNTVEDIAVGIDKETLEAQKLIQLAARQRMNTDIRRAIFCVIMSGEDYLDAFEKLLRLDLSGKQDREIMRVLVECCLQEKVFNKYYFLLAAKLCSHNKNHKFTLQYCLWDHFKEVESMEPRRSANLAKLVAELLSSFTLSLALLKAVDLMDLQQLTPNRITHFRMLFQLIFEKPDKVIWNIFTRVAAIPEREMLGQNLEFFIRKFAVTSDTGKSFAAKFQIAKKALDNVAGVLM